MPKRTRRADQYVFAFDFTVSAAGIPQPYPVPPADPQILFRYSIAKTDGGSDRQVLNVCGNAEGLKDLAAMLLLTADSEKYDPEFHIHLENMPGVEADSDVTIRAPVYLDILRRSEFTEFKGEPIVYPSDTPRHRPSARQSHKSRGRKPRKKK
jgi:hypothetical protein